MLALLTTSALGLIGAGAALYAFAPREGAAPREDDFSDAAYWGAYTDPTQDRRKQMAGDVYMHRTAFYSGNVSGGASRRPGRTLEQILADIFGPKPSPGAPPARPPQDAAILPVGRGDDRYGPETLSQPRAEEISSRDDWTTVVSQPRTGDAPITGMTPSNPPPDVVTTGGFDSPPPSPPVQRPMPDQLV